MTESPQTHIEILIHQLVVGKPANDGNIPAQCELLRCSLQEGMDILLWRADLRGLRRCSYTTIGQD